MPPWRRTSFPAGPPGGRDLQRPDRLSALDLQAGAVAGQCIDRGRIHRRGHSHFAIYGRGGLCQQCGDGDAGQWFQRLCQPFLFRPADQHDLHFYAGECAGGCTTSASGVQTCTPGTSVMQIQTQAPSPLPTARYGGDGIRRYAFVFPACLASRVWACRRRAWRNLAWECWHLQEPWA